MLTACCHLSDWMPPFGRHVAQPDDVHERLVEHARRGIDEHQHVLARDVHVTSCWRSTILRHAGARRAPAFSRRVLSSSDFRSALSRSRLTARERVVLVLRDSSSVAFSLSCVSRGSPEADGLAPRSIPARSAVPRGACSPQHFLLEPVRIRLQVGRSLCDDAGLRGDDRVEQHHRAETAGDHVQEGHAESSFSSAASSLSPPRRARARRPACRRATCHRRRVPFQPHLLAVHEAAVAAVVAHQRAAASSRSSAQCECARMPAPATATRRDGPSPSPTPTTSGSSLIA